MSANDPKRTLGEPAPGPLSGAGSLAGSFAMLAAMRRASSRVSSLAAELVLEMGRGQFLPFKVKNCGITRRAMPGSEKGEST